MRLFYYIIDGKLKNILLITLFLWGKVTGKYILTNDLGQDIEINSDQLSNYGELSLNDEPLVPKNKIDDNDQVMIINSEITKDDHPLLNKSKDEDLNIPESEGMISQYDKKTL
uniref:Uncharacterized protein n=1 Tax=Strongyloides papillosus TaxID=174720 RepID=A0A0N5BHY4_STREA